MDQKPTLFPVPPPEFGAKIDSLARQVAALKAQIAALDSGPPAAAPPAAAQPLWERLERALWLLVEALLDYPEDAAARARRLGRAA